MRGFGGLYIMRSTAPISGELLLTAERPARNAVGPGSATIPTTT